MSQPDGTLQVDIPEKACGPSLPAKTEITEVGPYKIISKIGQGAMGTVFLAEHVNLGRNVALKILPPEFADDAGRLERFQREMTAIGKLEHENIVLATDAGMADGYFYIAMQYVNGSDLAALLTRVNRFEPQAACEIIRQVALGLQHIHECDLVHRDIKPSNIVVTPNGAVKILDLGIARLRRDDDSDSALTTDNALMGTPDFMAPEQIHQCSNVDIRADIYSLGCTLYTLLSGRVPFVGPQYNNHVAKLVAHAEHNPERLSQLCPELPGPLVELVERMMSKSADDRPSTPTQVADELAPWSSTTNLTVLMAGNAPQLSTPQAVSPANRWNGQRSIAVQPTKTVALGVAGLVVLCLLGYLLPRIDSAARSTGESNHSIANSTEEMVQLQRDSNTHLGSIVTSTGNSTQQLNHIAATVNSIDARAEEIISTNESIEHNTKDIAASLDALRAKFKAFDSQSVIEIPQCPGDFYYNARVYGEKGDYRAARQAFLRYFQVDLDVVDPHLHFIEFLKLQEGLAGARDVYSSLPGDKALVSRRLATALLQEPQLRKQQLTRLTEEVPEFAPAFFELSRDFSTSQLGHQTLEDMCAEQSCLARFLELHDRGNLVRYYLDQSGAIENIQEAKERIAALRSGVPSLDDPVRFSFLLLGNEWRVNAGIAEACTEIFYRVGEGDEFKSTGTFQFGEVDVRTGQKPPNSHFLIADSSEPTTIAVKYIDVNGVEQGPFTQDFDPVKQRREFAIAMLKQNPDGWLRLHADGSLYFDLLFQWAGIAEFHYGIDDDTPRLTRPIPNADINEANALMYAGISVPLSTQFVSVQVEFTDGTVSDVVKIKRLDR